MTLAQRGWSTECGWPGQIKQTMLVGQLSIDGLVDRRGEGAPSARPRWLSRASTSHRWYRRSPEGVRKLGKDAYGSPAGDGCGMHPKCLRRLSASQYLRTDQPAGHSNLRQDRLVTVTPLR